MYNPRVPMQEQYRLVMECRQSGLSDHQWCIDHNIKPPTFYNWVKRLRQKGCCDIPLATGQSSKPSEKQEVVKINLRQPSVPNQTGILQPSSQNYDSQTNEPPAMKLTIGNFALDIHNGTDPYLLAQTIHALKESQC